MLLILKYIIIFLILNPQYSIPKGKILKTNQVDHSSV